MTVKLDRMREVEQRLSADVIATSSAVKQAAERRAWLYSLLLVAALVLAVVLALVTARSLIRPMRRLEAAAEETAEHRLPSVVQRLQDGEQVDLEAESAAPIEVRSRDEIGHLAEAFNSVHRVAVRVAGREAVLRRSVGDMFLNLARRSQSLIERQLEVIDELEVSGSAAEVRTGLGELDHLATRMRRNAENLIILSGSEPARRWRGPIELTEVVQAAVEEVKEHTRVELLPLDQVQLAGHAAADVMHLLAELIENAVTFSAPGTKALVAGQPLPAGYLIEIEDQGLGMSDEQLVKVNQRLAKPPDIDFALAKMLGFFVVTQLASKHGIKVQLRHSWYGGITALVLVPRRLIVQPTELAPLADGEAARRRGRSPVAAVADHPPAPGDGREPSADPDLDWIDSRVPMVHVPLRRPQAPVSAGRLLGAGGADELAADLVAGAAVQGQERVRVEAGLAVGRPQAQVLGRHVEAVGHRLDDAARLEVAAVVVPVGEEPAPQRRTVGDPVGGPDDAVVADLDPEGEVGHGVGVLAAADLPAAVAEHRLQHAEGEGPQGAGPLAVAARAGCSAGSRTRAGRSAPPARRRSGRPRW